jgi:hypothetical protein
MQREPVHAGAGAAATTVISGFVVGYAILGDNIVAVFVILAAAIFSPLIVWPIAAAIVTLVNIACCTWVTRRWSDFIAGGGGRIEKRLEGLRNNRFMRRPVAWISGGSTGRFTLAAILTNAIIAVAAAQMAGSPVDRRRIVCASLGFAAVSCALHTMFGFLIGSVVGSMS